MDRSQFIFVIRKDMKRYGTAQVPLVGQHLKAEVGTEKGLRSANFVGCPKLWSVNPPSSTT